MPYIGQGLTEGRRRVETFIATANQTTFNIIYDAGYVDVYQNGILLAEADYTATNGSQVVLAVGAALNDEITIIAHQLFSVTDTVSAAQGGTFTGAVTASSGVVGNITGQVSDISNHDTDALSEGSANLYYTDARVDARLASGSVGNIVTTGYIAGPANFVIDPAAVGDNTGTLVVAGNLQVDGTTTTINSTTLTVDDLNITLASGAANAAAANGAGITVDGASATLTYNSTDDTWDFNKVITANGVKVDDNQDIVLGTDDDLTIRHGGTNGSISNTTGNLGYNSAQHIFGDQFGSEYARIDSSGNVGIGGITPTNKLHVNSGTSNTVAKFESTDAGAYISLTDTTGTSSIANEGQYLYLDVDKDALVASSQMRFRVDGSTKLTINDSGYVGIGTTNPTEKVHIKSGGNAYKMLLLEAEAGSGDAGILIQGQGGNQFNIQQPGGSAGLFFYDRTNTAYRMYISSAGNIQFYEDQGLTQKMTWDASNEALLIGNHTSLRPGSVSGMNDAHLSVESVNYNPVSIVDNQNNATSPGMLVLGASRGGSAGGITIVQAGDNVGSLRFAAADGTDLRSNIAEIVAQVTTGTTPAENAVSGDLFFNTTNQGQNTSTKMAIKNTGFVGIGTTDPGAPLHVSTTSNETMRLDASDGQQTSIGFAHSNTVKFLVGNDLFANGNKNFFIYDSDVNSTRFIIDNSGKVGIGLSDPGGTLTINGGSTTSVVLKSSWSSGTHRIAFVGGSTNVDGSTPSSTAAKIESVATAPGGAATGDLRFFVNSGDSFIQSMTLESNGDVNIKNVGGAGLSHRNLIQNGQFHVAQRATVHAITGPSDYQYICIDRWGNYYSGTTISQETAIVDGMKKTCMRINASSADQNLYTFQWIEHGGRKLGYGAPFSVSFKARANATGSMNVELRWGNFGAASAAATDTIGSGQTLTTDWQTYKFENLTYASRNYEHVGLWIYRSNGGGLGSWIEITDVQVELGSICTEYEQKSYAEEMNACQRYYQRLPGQYGTGTAGGDRGIVHMHNWGTTNWYGVHHFTVPMRTGPTLKFSSGFGGVWYSGGTTSNHGSWNLQHANEYRAEMAGTHTSGNFTAGGSCWFRLGSASDYVAFDAEHL